MDLPITLRILVGSCIQPAETALSLGPGSVVSLDPDSRGQVSIMVEDKLIAHGNLVLNDGRLAVQVTSITADNQRN